MNKTITILLAALTIMSCANNAKQAQSLKDKPWQEIAPTEIELNPVQIHTKPTGGCTGSSRRRTCSFWSRNSP